MQYKPMLIARLAALDAILTGRLDNLELKVRTLNGDMRELRDHLWYCSDGGISRIAICWDEHSLTLEGPPSERARLAWDSPGARALIGHIELYLKYNLARLVREAV